MGERLHIVCGMCGCNKMLNFKIELKGSCDGDGVESPAVFVTCGNCGSLTDLSEVMASLK